jgi:hypothetical protein
VQHFHASEVAYGFSLSDHSLFEVGYALATLGNTSGAVFWLIFYVFSNADGLREIRDEIATIITTSDGADRRHHLDMTRANSGCHTLFSTFRDSIRLHSIGISLRQVCKDTNLA